MKERVQIKHDLEENWKKAVNFIPLPGELVIYDGIIENGKYIKMPRFKIGDGITKINDLPFMDLQPQSKVVAKNEDGVLVIGEEN